MSSEQVSFTVTGKDRDAVRIAAREVLDEYDPYHTGWVITLDVRPLAERFGATTPVVWCADVIATRE